MRILKLNDKSEINIYRCGAYDGRLYIGVENMTMEQAFSTFSDTGKTAHMVSGYDSDGSPEEMFDGYTGLFYLQKDGAGCLVGLVLEEGA